MKQSLNTKDLIDCIELVLELQKQTTVMLQNLVQHMQNDYITQPSNNFKITKNMRRYPRCDQSSGSVRLLQWRHDNKITQVQLAKMLGIAGTSSISMWEHGNQTPSAPYRKKIQEVTHNFVLGRSWKEIH